jgi:Raf kinase inhibitor-like YbhB/YbcL family protein
VSAGLTLRSAAFPGGAAIPARYTCDGSDHSPPLTWSGAPPTTRSFALVCDDPDAPGKTWVHWVLYNLPADLTQLPEDVPRTDTLDDPEGALQGMTDFRRVGYGGPCPPPGGPHRYVFRLYALDAPLGLAAGATRAQVDQAMRGHVVAEAQLMGTYERRR